MEKASALVVDDGRDIGVYNHIAVAIGSQSLKRFFGGELERVSEI